MKKQNSCIIPIIVPKIDSIEEVSIAYILTCKCTEWIDDRRIP